jgi:hypothetical protein
VNRRRRCEYGCEEEDRGVRRGARWAQTYWRCRFWFCGEMRVGKCARRGLFRLELGAQCGTVFVPFTVIREFHLPLSFWGVERALTSTMSGR